MSSPVSYKALSTGLGAAIAACHSGYDFLIISRLSATDTILEGFNSTSDFSTPDFSISFPVVSVLPSLWSVVMKRA
jgi:hypothetical protein